MFLYVILFFPMSKRKPRSFTPASHSAHLTEHGYLCHPAIPESKLQQNTAHTIYIPFILLHP